MPALLLGSIGVLAETSDLQREAFNAAFAEAGLDWHWERDAYAEMLTRSGGRDRIARHAERTGAEVDADALHARKSQLFRERLAQGVAPRPGVDETISAAREAGWRVGFVASTSRENVDATLAATGIDARRFDLVLCAGDVERGKPDPEVYRLALARLGMAPGDAVAVEDNPGGLAAAEGAEIACVAFPGAFHDRGRFAGATGIVDRLSLPVIPAA